MARALHLLVAAASAGLLAGCGSTPASPGLAITQLEVVSENIDPSFWSRPLACGQTAFFDFFLHYQGDIAFRDIAWARVFPVGGFHAWDVAPDEAFVDTTARIIGGWGHWYDGYDPNVLPLGDLQADVVLSNGDEAIAHALVPAPGSSTAGVNTMFNEDVVPAPGASAPMIRRASLGAASSSTAATQTLQLTFSVTDPNVYNGFVWLLDAAGRFVGASAPFRDPVSGLLDPALGGQLATDGSVNTVTLPASSLAMEGGATFGQIARYRVVLTDGAQYGLQPSGVLRLSSRSISAAQAFTLQ